MKKLLKPISLITAALLLTVTVYAEEIKDGFQLVLQKYSEDSPTYKSIELQQEKIKSDDYLNEYSLKASEISLENNEKQIESLEY